MPDTPAPDPVSQLAGVLDAQALERLRELDPQGTNGLLPRVLKAFDGSLDRLLAQLGDARARGDREGMRHVAHTLKSSSASVGALELSRICADIEAAIRDRQAIDLEPLLDDMAAQSSRLRAALRPVLADRP